MSLSNRNKISHHDLVLTEYKQISGHVEFLVKEKQRQEEREKEMFGEIRRKFEKHEEKEDGQFKEIATKIEKLNVNVALLRHSPLLNGEKISG